MNNGHFALQLCYIYMLYHTLCIIYSSNMFQTRFSLQQESNIQPLLGCCKTMTHTQSYWLGTVYGQNYYPNS